MQGKWLPFGYLSTDVGLPLADVGLPFGLPLADVVLFVLDVVLGLSDGFIR